MSGVSFLPYSDHVYEQAPYEEITFNRYEILMSERPAGFDMAASLTEYEAEDNTTSSHEMACSAGHCDI